MKIINMVDELLKLSQLPQKVSLYLTSEFIPVGYIERVEIDYIVFREDLGENREVDPVLIIPIDRIKYLRLRRK